MPFLPDTRNGPRESGPADAFRRLVPSILERFLWQNSRPAPPREPLIRIGAQLWALVAERGLDPPLPAGESGEPGEIPEEACAALVARVLDGIDSPLRDELALPVRHLIKASFNPQFRKCRNSYREASPDGRRRRQELPRARQRTSGSHCVDCPYWTSLTPGQDLRLLNESWAPNERAELAAHLDVFLPEDFRAYRQLIEALRNGPDAFAG